MLLIAPALLCWSADSALLVCQICIADLLPLLCSTLLPSALPPA